MNTPNPGSREAVEAGCRCPRMDNGFGRGYMGGIKDEAGKTVFFFSDKCPLHRDEIQPPPPKPTASPPPAGTPATRRSRCNGPETVHPFNRVRNSAMLPNTSHAPTTATLKIHRPALEKVGSILGPLWLLEGECLSVRHARYFRKLRKLDASLKEVAAELRDLLAEQACCQECASTAAEWDRFEQDRPDNLTALDRVIRAEKEAQAERELAYSFAVPVDHPDGCGCDRCVTVALVSVRDDAIHAGNWTSCDGRRGA